MAEFPSTNKGIFHISFEENENQAWRGLETCFPRATYPQSVSQLQQNFLLVFKQNWSQTEKIKLHLHGTDFQLKAWEALLKIPVGSLTTYGAIAKGISRPTASRAAGNT